MQNKIHRESSDLATDFSDFKEHPTPPDKFKQLKLKRAPKPREIYWCIYPDDAVLPEFWKKRPVVVISRGSTLRSAVTVLPLTTHDQGTNKFAVNLGKQLGKKDSWVVCNHPSTLSLARFNQTGRATKRMSEEHFDQALALMDAHLVRHVK
jgi:mRNA interferase MazF